jgi:hypothetical protein
MMDNENYSNMKRTQLKRSLQSLNNGTVNGKDSRKKAHTEILSPNSSVNYSPNHLQIAGINKYLLSLLYVNFILLFILFYFRSKDGCF